MHIALRPYLTTGIAIVGASVIAVAPIAVPPPDLPSVEVTASGTVRSVSTDVELTASWVDLLAAVPEAAALILQVALQPVPLPAELEALAIALVKAGVPAVTETAKLFTEALPTSALNLIATGQFAHFLPLAANAVYMGTLTPIAPFLVTLMEAVPLPIGTTAGAFNEFLKVTIQTPFLTGNAVLTLFAEVIDNGLSPAAALLGAIDAVTIGLTSAVESIEKIVATLGGALPISVMAAPEGLGEARAMAADTPAIDDGNVVASSVSPSTEQGVVDTVTVTMDPSALEKSEGTGTAPVSAAADELADEGLSADDETSNGATDLSDGNMVEPGTVNDGADEDSNGSTVTRDDATTVEGDAGDQTATTTDSSTGSDEGSGDNGDSPGE